MRTSARPKPPYSDLLKGLRKKHRYSLRELEKETGVSRGYLSLLENGYNPKTSKVLRPSREVLQSIGKVLGETQGALMEAAGYLPEIVTGAIKEKRRGYDVKAKAKLTIEEVEEIKTIVSEVVEEVLRRRGLVE